MDLIWNFSFDFCISIVLGFFAGLAHPVERHLAKVEVASSSLVTRSSLYADAGSLFFVVYRGKCFSNEEKFEISFVFISVGDSFECGCDSCSR